MAGVFERRSLKLAGPRTKAGEAGEGFGGVLGGCFSWGWGIKKELSHDISFPF